jgi:hypothetical protein
MAVFNKNTLAQVSGFDNQIIAGELVYQQKTYWNIRLAQDACSTPVVPINLTGATISAQIVRRTVSNVVDTRNGLTFNIGNYTPTPTPINLTITNRDDATGFFTVVLDDSAWGIIAGEAGLDIAASSPVAFSGRIKVSFAASGTTPADDTIIFLLFLIRSDGITNV